MHDEPRKGQPDWLHDSLLVYKGMEFLSKGNEFPPE